MLIPRVLSSGHSWPLLLRGKRGSQSVGPHSLTRHGWFRLPPIDQYSSLLPPVGVWAVSQSQCRFRRFSPCCGQVAHALRTLPPVAASSIATPALPLDLHVLGLPLAFILSQDQTLHRILSQYLLADPSAPDSSVQEINALSYCFGTSFVLLFQSCQ